MSDIGRPGLIARAGASVGRGAESVVKSKNTLLLVAGGLLATGGLLRIAGVTGSELLELGGEYIGNNDVPGASANVSVDGQDFSADFGGDASQLGTANTVEVTTDEMFNDSAQQSSDVGTTATSNVVQLSAGDYLSHWGTACGVSPVNGDYSNVLAAAQSANPGVSDFDVSSPDDVLLSGGEYNC